MSVLFIIPARGGSKGLPGKNLKTVGGIPIVGRSARVARQAAKRLSSGCRIICSTDDPDIAEAAKAWGAEVPFLRPAELATDTAKSIDVVIHAINAIGKDVDSVVLLQPTSPLVEERDIAEAITLHMETGDSVVSVCANEHPLDWSYSLDANGILVPYTKHLDAHQRQSSTKTYRLNGAIYIASVKTLLDKKTFFGEKTRGYVMPVERSVDIDNKFDLQFAEFVLSNRKTSIVEIEGRTISPGHPCFMIAEAGVNHNGDLGLAKQMIDAAIEAGADAVKFQTFKAEKVVSPTAPRAAYQKVTTGAFESQLDMVKRLELPFDSFRVLYEYCNKKKILFMSTPFDEESAEFLCSLGMPVIKVSSGEITNLPFLKKIAGKKVPIILSTGMSSMVEVAAAVDTIRDAGNEKLVLLHCVSSYPADPKDVNLKAMKTMQDAFGVPVGYSDHTQGIEVSLAAVALGACVIEKHFTLDRNLPGPDHKASLVPEELRSLVLGIRNIEKATGDGNKDRRSSEENVAQVARRSVFAAREILCDQIIEIDDLIALRPGTGIPANRITEFVGKRAARNIPAHKMIQEDDIV